jgi:hypothetical protein
MLSSEVQTRVHDTEAGLGETPNDRLTRLKAEEAAQKKARGGDNPLPVAFNSGVLEPKGQ